MGSENCSLDPRQAVFNCAHQGYFLASALHGGFEALTIAFFALRPSAALLRAVQRFLLNSTFDDDLAWNSMGYGPWGCGWVWKFQGAFGRCCGMCCAQMWKFPEVSTCVFAMKNGIVSIIFVVLDTSVSLMQ